MVTIKAVTTATAIELWIDEFKIQDFENDTNQSHTEEELSIMTWVGCENSDDYHNQKNRWKHKNNQVIAEIKEKRPEIKIDRVMKRENGFIDIKICKITDVQAQARIKTSIHMAAGHMAGAEQMKEIHNITFDTSKELISHYSVKLDKLLPDLTVKERQEKMVELAFQHGAAVGHQIGQANVVEGVINKLSGGTLQVTDKNVSVQDDQYSQDIDAKRKSESETYEEVPTPNNDDLPKF